MAKERVRIAFECDAEEKAFLERLAQEQGRTLSNLVRRLLSEVVDERRMAARRARFTETTERYAT
jgi:hypothetical protein